MSEITITPSDQDHQVLKVADALRPLRGRRLDKILREARTTLHAAHTPGEIVEMSRGRRYRIAPDGSYRKF